MPVALRDILWYAVVGLTNLYFVKIYIGDVLFMENAPSIILFWCFITAISILMVGLMCAATVLIKKGKEQSMKQMQIAGKLCLVLSIICSAPILLAVGYILYLYIA